ncbi:MAG TPA: glycosyltransferase [Candidatus Limnocylindrales bacterium]
MTPRQDAAGSGEAGGQSPDSTTAPGADSLRTERIRILSDELRATRAELTASTQELDRTHRELAALRRRRSVRLALGVSRLIAPVAGAVRRVAPATARQGARQAVGAGEPRKRLRATEGEEARLRSRLASVLRPARSTSGPLVSIVIPTRDGLDHLRRLLPALDQIVYRDVEIVVVDNGSRDGTAAWLAANRPSFPTRVIANPENRSYADANNQGVAAATGELILLLNNDTEPAGPHVLGHMVDRVVDDATVVAVGSRLIYPRRSGPAMGPVSVAADLSLQHRGVAFATVDGTQVAVHVGRGEDPLGHDASERREIEMATAACLLVRRAAFEAVGGFSGGYDYGMEDVDLALKLRAAGGRVIYEPQATFWHHESATQAAEARASRAERQTANRALLQERWGPRIARETFLDRLSAARSWASGPLHVGITLTRDDEHAGWGDWYTAHELGEALEAIGWRVSYLERWKEHWYTPDRSIDVVISLLDAFDVRRLPPGVVSVAWVRNWTERWLGQPWFEDFDIVLASSQRSKDLIDGASVHVAGLMPLATNPVRFRGGDTREPVEGVDVAFTANRWGEARGVEAIAPVLSAAGRSVAVFGKGWEAVPEMAGVTRGALAYADLPAAYADAAIVIDDTATPTLPYGAVNSRVFDALAVGTLVITDNVMGARELFGASLPAAAEPDEIVRLAERYLDDPEERRRLAIELRNIVIERHTYAHRAAELRAVLERWASAPRVDIAIGPPESDLAQLWGDFHFGRDVQRALHQRGLPSRLRLRPSWAVPDAAAADVLIHVFGAFGPEAPPPRSGQLSIVWVISHPDLVTDEVVAPYDLVFVASDSFAARLADRLGRPVAALHQATDAERFMPRPGGPAHELLFVANSRGVRRRIVDELTPTDVDLAVFGRHWTPDLLDPRYLRGENVPNEELATYYSAASIVLNDHWSDMAEQGFMSNRLYDAAACGAFVISDRVQGIDTEFDDGVVTFETGDELRALVRRYLDDPAARAAHAERARAAVLARHTFAHRVDAMLAAAAEHLERRASRISVTLTESVASGGPA